MYRSNPIVLSLRSLSHRPYFRNVLYTIVALSFLFLLFSWQNLDVKSYAPFPGEVVTEIPIVDEPPAVWEDRAEQVKSAFVFSYHAYERFAMPHDELRPLTGGYVDNFNGWGVSMIDSLDTMLLMGLKEEYSRALVAVEKMKFQLSKDKVAPYFETVIRYLGGLLSAYALTKDKILLLRADELAEKLDPVFSTPSHLPLYGINPSTGKLEGPEIGILAEIASMQLEYATLAKMTGKTKWSDRVHSVVRTLSTANLRDTGGMFPVGWNVTNGKPVDTRLSAGAQADSAHEYLLKLYLLSAKTDKANLEMYIRMTTHLITNLLYLSPTRHLLYVTDSSNGRVTHKFEHLSCFLPGLLALGAHTLPLDDLASLGIDLSNLAARGLFDDASQEYRLLKTYNLTQLHMWAAEGLAQTCWLSYADQPTGLGPDEMLFKTTSRNGYTWIDAIERWRKSGSRGVPPGVDDKRPIALTKEQLLKGDVKSRDYMLKKSGYLLRPETIESLYLMWRFTGDFKWRVRGWKIFEAIQRHTKTQYGYASVRNVESLVAPKLDELPSYFFAETLKYLYLMFKNEDLIPLDQWVLNTEAHPLPIQWTFNTWDNSTT
ncbi:glycoside hydrolase family 47 protein [Marasmius fiardii PR-910]|nr:glycoside hydrolase family 47 protein [Marasmius fiardii PR-910]